MLDLGVASDSHPKKLERPEKGGKATILKGKCDAPANLLILIENSGLQLF